MKNSLYVVMAGLALVTSVAVAGNLPAAMPAGADPAASSPPGPLVCTIDNSFWQKPRSAARILANPDLHPCVDALLATPGSILQINAPDSDEAAIEADELRQWLIALALPAARIRVASATGNLNLQLELHHD